MPKKKDPSVTFLNQFGYNVVKLPRAGIEPMDVIGKDETTQWLGPLRAVWKSSVPEPAPSAPRAAMAVNGQKTSQLELGFGIKILANALAAFGASVPSLDLVYSKASKVQFSYSNVTSTVVAPFDAGSYLTSGTLNTDNPIVKHYFQEPEAEAFLILDVLKSDSITVTAVDSGGVEVGVDVPAIQGIVGANVKVKTGGSGDSSLTFTGPAPVTFGFIVDQIEFDGTKWSLSGAAAAGGLAFGAAAAAGGAGAPASTSIFLGTGCRIRLS